MTLTQPKRPLPALPDNLPSLSQIRQAHQQLQPYLNHSPLLPLELPSLPCDTYAKYEIWQPAGSFKIRAALLTLQQLSDAELDQGIIAATAGNHGLAVAYASTLIPTSVKLIMPKSTDPARVAACRELGATIEFIEHIDDLFDYLHEIQKTEQRTLIHPFEGVQVTTATATIALEMHQQCQDLDAIIVAVGGGGLLSGIAYASQLLRPTCRVIGVEPSGAASLTKSYQAGSPQHTHIDTIARSLAVATSEPFSYSVSAHYADGLVTVTDGQTQQAMDTLCEHLNLALEPAAAIGLAALQGPLQYQLKGKKVAVILCGSNLSAHEWQFDHLDNAG